MRQRDIRSGQSAFLSVCLLALSAAGVGPAVGALSARPNPDPAMWGSPVVRVRLDCDARLKLEEFADDVTQKVGQPLDRMKVQETLKNLFATGRFRDLRVEVEPVSGGVELIIAARAAYFVGTVRVEGVKAPLDPGILVTASRLRLGQRFADEDLVLASARLGSVMRENGYYQASINYRVAPNADTQAADIVFLISPGQHARLRSVEFHGDLEVPIQTLTSTSGWKVRAHLTSAQLERGLHRIHQLYLKLGMPQAMVTVLSREFNPLNNGETLAVQIEAGPKVEVRIEGANISTAKLREILPFYIEGSLDETAVERGGDALRDYFERQGYFGVMVQGERSSPEIPQTVEITYKAQLGERGVFVGFAFQGNDSISAQELESAVAIHPKDFLHERGTFSRELMKTDVNTLKALYQRRGYLAAEVQAVLDEDYEGRRGHLFATFKIVEGPKTIVSRLELQGADQETLDGLRSILFCRPGEGYSPGNAQADREAILNYLADRGYPWATVDMEAQPASSAHEIDLNIHVEPGLLESVKRVVVLGQEHTREGTIRRELKFKGGHPLRQSEILESQRQLYDLGIFRQVQIATEDTRSRESGRTVLVGLEGAKRWTVSYGGGIEFQRLGSDQPQGVFKTAPRLSLEISRLNVGGRAQTASLRGRFSSIETGGAFSYLIPRFPTRRDLSLRLTALVDRSREVITFTSKRREVIASLEKRFSPTTFLAGRFSFRKVQASDFAPGAEQQIPISSRDARITMLGLSYANDHRDEPTDATRGSYSLADVGFAVKKLGSQSNFFRISGQNATYYRVSPRLVFARNTRLAIETTVGNVTETGEIPLPERFFMGGSESHRGFSINQAGPRDPVEGFPLGGEALFLNSLELRVRFASDRLGFVLFQDAGNVYSKVQQMRLLKFKQNSATDLNFTSLAAGLGVRYKTPVGPVRFDVGYNFNPPRYQVVTQSSTPDGVVELRRLPRFQFFLGIGQSF